MRHTVLSFRVKVPSPCSKIFGRKPVILGSLVLFAVGSAIGGAAPTQAVLILGRGIYPKLSGFD